mmetsp:Transcript_37122/g.60118  ORF Transcript_37122/g.60118 Transcript_37122/m.60118 type:complete len:89 (-) Transcript_37122:125-391(-)
MPSLFARDEGSTKAKRGMSASISSLKRNDDKVISFRSREDDVNSDTDRREENAKKLKLEEEDTIPTHICRGNVSRPTTSPLVVHALIN